MARMIPPAVAAHTSSGAERRLFDRIQNELGDEWIVLHSLGLTIHDRKPWAEIDFVLIGPPGVFCLEVKGGLVTREAGRWYTTPQRGDGAGRRNPLNESPFEQAGSAAAKLYSWLEPRVPELGKSVTGYAVATPDVEWTVHGPDIDRALVYDHRDSLEPFSAFMDRVASRWNEKVGRGWHRELELLGRRAKNKVVDAIRADFALVPSLRAEAESSAEELLRLTDEQAALFARLATNSRVVARGGAGTGKTLLAAAEARRLAGEGRRVLLTCFSKNLAMHIAEALDGVEGITVQPLHALMQDVVVSAGSESRIPDVGDADRFELFLPELALEALLEDPPTVEFDAVIVDEGQDVLLEQYVDVIDALLARGLDHGIWRWFLDPNQNVFTGVARRGMARLLATGPVDWPLTVNCRNTSPIATQVALLTDMEPVETLTVDGPPVEYLWWEDPTDERRQVAKRVGALLHEGFAPDQITLLSPHRLQNSCMAEDPVVGKGPLTDISRGGWTDRTDGVRFSTVASFKGLESDVVVLVDLDDLSEDIQPLLYVGASRARVLLVVTVAESERTRFGELAREFGRRLDG